MNIFSAKQRSSRTRRLGSRLSLEPLEGRALLSGDAPLLIQLNSAAALRTVSAMAAGAGASLAPSPISNLVVASGDPSSLRSLEAVVSKRGLTEFIEPQQTFTVATTANDPYYVANKQWDLSGTYGIQAPTAWDTTTGSTKVTVADLDTGIDYTHPDLYLNVWLNQGEIPASRRANLKDLDGDGLITFWDLNDPSNQGPGKITDLDGDGRITGADVLKPMGKTGGADNGTGGWADGISNDGATASGTVYIDDLIGWNFVNNTNNPYDDHGHGTHTAGTIGAIGNNGVGVAGVNWKSQLMSLKFLDSRGSGSDLGAAAALNYSVDLGARVSNNSYAGGGGGRVLGNAIAYAATQGDLFVAAAGNSTSDNDLNPSFPSSYANDNVLSVAAIDAAGNLAWFSNFGATSVDLAAPGNGIYSTFPITSDKPSGYANMSGTSMASPHVAGAAALLLSVHPTWTYSQVASALMSNATSLASLAGKTVSGGTLNVGKALAASSDPPTVSQVFVSGSNWTSAFKGNLGNSTFGYAIPSGSAQNKTLPWANANRVSIRFSRPVDPATLTGALSMTMTTTPIDPLQGPTTRPYTGTISLGGYDSATNTATFNLSGYLSYARYNLTLSDSVKSPDGVAIDGNWSNSTHAYPSGDGTPGGAFNFAFRSLPGDVDRSGGVVGSVDHSSLINMMYNAIGDKYYYASADLDGNGKIDSIDHTILINFLFTSVVA